MGAAKSRASRRSEGRGCGQGEEGLDVWDAMGIEAGRPYYWALLADAYGNVGQAEMLPMVPGVGQWWEGRVAAQVEVEVEAEVRAEACFDQALEAARWQAAKSLELRAGLSLSRL